MEINENEVSYFIFIVLYIIYSINYMYLLKTLKNITN